MFDAHGFDVENGPGGESFGNDATHSATNPVDYTDAYNRAYGVDVLGVQAHGRCMLVFWKLEHPKAMTVYGDDGRKRRVVCEYGIESYSLSCDAREGKDDFAGVAWGPDSEYLTARQAAPYLAELRAGGSMFRHTTYL